MKMKTGISIVAVAAVGIYIAYGKKRKIKNNYFNNFSENYFKEYSNKYNPQSSFIEFFDKDSLKEAYGRYDKYLDLGLNKTDAFKAVVEDDRNS
jgi:hypothetical protein